LQFRSASEYRSAAFGQARKHIQDIGMTKDHKNVVGSDRSRFALSKTRVALRAVVITIAFGIAAILGENSPGLL
jgi:hypothetical protein